MSGVGRGSKWGRHCGGARQPKRGACEHHVAVGKRQPDVRHGGQDKRRLGGEAASPVFHASPVFVHLLSLFHLIYHLLSVSRF
jgi:hypothetical protein